MDGAVTIVGLGDSITEAATGMPEEDRRWLKLLECSLGAACPDRSFRVINAGVGGQSDREKMARFERDVLACGPDRLLLQFGGNNVGFDQPERRVEPAETEALLEQVRRSVPADTRLFVITFPPVIDAWHKTMSKPGAPEYFAAFGGLDACVERYRRVTRDFAHRYGYPLIDLYREIRQCNDPGRYTLPDGVHLTVAGNALLARLVYETLLPGLTAGA